jgi:hypothetical protein
MVLAPLGQMSARPGSKNASLSAGSLVKSSTLGGGPGVGDVAEAEDGCGTAGAGAGDSAAGPCSWIDGCPAGVAGADAVCGCVGSGMERSAYAISGEEDEDFWET